MYRVKPIGVIHSPFREPKDIPIQSSVARDIEGTVEVYKEYMEGLKDLDGFSHIILIYYFHLSKKYSLKVKPFMDDNLRGVFSTRAPSRPNNIGLSIVRLIKIEGNILYIKDVDVVDGTPLLDIKPYVPEFDVREDVRIGWLRDNIYKLSESKDDGRFIKD
ncbi:MAG: tRNA (N6-threonylcarbamoyladenosine(37)-N6)-methyltransferase TrmO [Thermoplasmata archaeon]|nr:MAG: tRNA (N6-threonylcarbamoyladenosine(37)-N6)-methyltransferase TrmO [Thermoplasmata archaeon]HEC89032.1 tRNA (N6-threonylcarbamoyladenosine(37)-N6)-methyltransferase TrmO [Thermoplasmatales archaeon]